MSVDFGGAGLLVPEHFAQDEQRRASRDGEAGETVPKIVKSDITQVRRKRCGPPHLPVLLTEALGRATCSSGPVSDEQPCTALKSPPSRLPGAYLEDQGPSWKPARPL